MIISNVLKPEEEVQPVPYDDSQLEISEEAASESAGGEVEDLENELGEQLSSMLNQMDGVSETEVMINLEATSEQVYEKIEQQGSRRQTKRIETEVQEWLRIRRMIIRSCFIVREIRKHLYWYKPNSRKYGAYLL